MKIFRTVILASLLLNHPSAHATSFDCNRGRSVPEQLICHRADLSKLDDELGKLYRQARRSVASPKALRADSDSKWAWREANCADEACLRTWYSGRIEELQRLLASLQQGEPAQPDAPDQSGAPAPHLRELPRDPGRRVLARAQPDASAVESAAQTEAAVAAAPTASPVAEHASTPLPRHALPLQCTAADPGMAWHDQCATVLKQDTRWQYPSHSGDWFCKLATLAQSPAEPLAEH
jgi:uncharacterized protein YecT (DUF1311 family)